MAYTRGADGLARIYINGKEATAARVSGDLSAWDSQLRLALGNEFTGDRGWLGVYHGVVKESNAFTLEVWITPAAEVQTGPARIVTLSRDHGSRNFTLGQDQNAYEMRLRTTATSANGLPSLHAGGDSQASFAAARSLQRDRAAIMVTRGGLLKVDRSQLEHGLQTQWFDPRTATYRPAVPNEEGDFQPPSREIWLLVLR